MLMPKKVKYRKVHRGRRSGKAIAGSEVHFGDFGLQALESCWMTSNQIEAARVAMTRHVKRGGKIWIRIFPDKPFTKKPAETRMGSGKGAPEGWVAVIKPGRVLFQDELHGRVYFAVLDKLDELAYRHAGGTGVGAGGLFGCIHRLADAPRAGLVSAYIYRYRRQVKLFS